MTHIICIKRKVIHSKIDIKIKALLNFIKFGSFYIHSYKYYNFITTVENGETGVDSTEAKENLERVE